MKKLALLFLILLNCQLGTAEGVGNHGFVGQGIGNIISSPVFLMVSAVANSSIPFIKYHSNLKLSRSSATSMTIDNSTLAQPSAVSSIQFEKLEGKFESLEQLAGSLDKTKTWAPVTLTGASGFANINRTSTRLLADYYVRTNDNGVIHIKIDAQASADGLKLIAPIVNTFSFDVTPPTITQMRLEGSTTVRPGDKIRVFVDAEDDISGISTLSMLTFTSFYKAGSNFQIYFSSEFFKNVGANQFIFDFIIPKTVPSGEYAFSGITVIDNAHNTSGAWLQSSKQKRGRGFEPFYANTLGFPLKNMPILKINVINPNPVTKEQVVISDLRQEKIQVKAGDNLDIFFKVSDLDLNSSSPAYPHIFMGVDPVNMRITRNTSGIGGYNIPTGYSIDPKKSEVFYQLFVPFKTLPGEYFVSRFSVDAYSKASTVLVSDERRKFYIDSETKQSTTIPVIKFVVLPDDRSDKTPPVIHSITLGDEFNVTTDSGSLVVKVTDDLSGVASEGYNDASFTAVSPSANGASFEASNMRFSSQIASHPVQGTSSLGHDLYKLVPNFNPYLPPGEYVMNSLTFRDRAKNQVTLIANLKDGFYHIGNLAGNETPTDIPIVRINLSR